MENQEQKKKFYKRWWFWVGAIVVVLIIIVSSGGGTPSIKSVPAPAETGSTAAGLENKGSVSPAQPSAPQTLLDLSGSGTKTTQKFTVASDWDLNWSYDCSSLGMQGNFQVFVYTGAGALSFENAMVNQLGASGANAEHYHNGGTFYLVMNSVCKWKIQVKG